MNANEYEKKLKDYIVAYAIEAEHLSFDQSCHSVEEAANVVNARAEDFVKNICLIDPQNRLIVAIVKGEDRVSRDKVAQIINSGKPRLARAEEILARTGYPMGGTPSFGYEATFLIDPKILQKTLVYTGGGSQTALVRISPQALLKANNGRLVDISQ
jgi:Cys-tRNA(Pro)/Cys-tRNA(Cys) deacylase